MTASTEHRRSTPHGIRFGDGGASGGATVVDYGGVLRVRYRLVRPTPVGLALPGRRRTVQVRVDQRMPRPLPVSPVHNGKRLRLTARGEGTTPIKPITLPESMNADQWYDVEELEMPAGGGFVRLFMPPRPGFPLDVAVLDPPIEELTC